MMEKVLEERVLRRITPSAAESRLIDRAAATLVERVKRVAPSYRAAVGGLIEPVVVGSVAKGTYLKEADVDVFMKFPVGTSRKTLEQTGLDIGRKVLEDPIMKYAEHPYLRGRVGNVNIDLVPCYAITDPSMKMSAVDRTPFQSAYVNSRMEIPQRDQVRLLKRFFKGIGVYGAEARVNGFSGYLAELIILRYGNFISAVGAISHWKKGESISVEEGSTGSAPSPSEACLTMPDPVDAARNVAAAVGADAFSLAVIACRTYLRKGSIRFFFPRDARPASLQAIGSAVRDSGHGLLMLSMRKPDVVDDNLYPQIQKARRNLTSLLRKYDFEVNRTVFSVDRQVKILFELKHRSHPRYWLREGPGGWSENSLAFMDKHARAGGTLLLVEGTLYSEEEKQFSDPRRLVSVHLPGLSLGADIDRAKASAKIALNDKVITAGNAALLSSLLFTRFPWEQ